MDCINPDHDHVLADNDTAGLCNDCGAPSYFDEASGDYHHMDGTVCLLTRDRATPCHYEDGTRYGMVTLDGCVTIDAVYDPRVRWNGWLCPSFDREAVDAVMAVIGVDPDSGTTHAWDGDTLVITERDLGTNETYIDRMPPIDGRYPLGSHAWVWSEWTPVDA